MSIATLTVLQLVEQIAEQFDSADLFYGHGTENATDEAVYLVFTVCDIEFNCSEQMLKSMVSKDQHARISSLAEQRIQQRIPMAYLLQQAWFCDLSFYVDQRVLIPRSPIAELIQQQFQPWVKPEQVQRILDIGTGSACIAIACAYAFPDADVDAVDIEPDALEVANQNIQQHAVSDRVQAIQSDLFSELTDQTYDIIVSNPPYVSDQEIQTLANEYHHEPVSGLRADDHGLSLVKRLLVDAKHHLNDNGILVVEVGYSQAALIEALPDVPFLWFEFANGGEGVFLLTQEQLCSVIV